MKKTNKLIVIFFLIITFINNYSFARYMESINVGNYYAKIAEPIFVVTEVQETYEFEANEQNINKEYYFIVKNYDDNSQRVSEVDLEFDIEIELSNNNFPVSFKLYDCTSNEEIFLDNLNKTGKIFIEKNTVFEKQYKLVTYWNEKQEMSENVEINIIVNASQK